MSCKLANRHMLWMETLAGAISASGGISMIFGTGMVREAFAAMPASLGIPYRILLGGPLILMGIALTATCIFEWQAGREWGEARLLAASNTRYGLNLGLALGNAAVLVAAIQAGIFWSVPSITLSSTMLAIACAAAAVKARRLSVLLDPSYKTERLRERLPSTW